MDTYKRYMLSTSIYGICAVMGIALTFLFAVRQEWFFTILSILFTYVSVDNFFCGSRAKTCSSGITGHYILPWKIKK